MAALPDNLFKYYANSKPINDGNDSKAKDTEIEVISEEEAKKPPPPSAPTPPPKKKRGFLTGKRIIVAVILFLIAVDIPIGLQLVRQYQDNRTPASSPSPTKQPQALAPLPTVVPSPIPILSPTPPISPVSNVTPSDVSSLEVNEPSPLPTEAEGLAQSLPQTHAECFDGACIEVEGPGVDQCIVDDDCLQPSPTKSSKLADGGVGGSGLEEEATEEATSPAIPIPDTPAAGNITNTIIGILSGVGVLLFALIL